jgi:predicted transcriptional regulator of viral defense system
MNASVILARLAERHDGLVFSEHARAAGVSADQLWRHTKRGELLRLHPGVFRHTAVAPSPRQLLVAAVHAAGPGAVVSHRSAARLWGLTERFDDVVDILTTRRRRVRLEGVIAHQVPIIRPEHCSLRAGFMVTTVERTLVDLGSVLPRSAVDGCFEQALITERTTFTRVAAAVDVLMRPGATGAAVLRAVLDDWLLGLERPDSALEPAMARLLARFGVRPGIFHHRVHDESGRLVAEIDFAWPDARLAVEIDGFAHHSSRTSFQRDRARQNHLVAAGWRVLRFTWEDVVRRPSHIAALIAAELAAAA